MFAKSFIYYGTGLAAVDIVASETPEIFPVTTDGIDNAGSGYTLAPGSTMYVTGTGKKIPPR